MYDMYVGTAGCVASASASAPRNAMNGAMTPRTRQPAPAL